MKFFLEILSQTANSVDHDQTGAVWSGTALFAYSILSEILVYEIFRAQLFRANAVVS